ncbi:transmembrane 220 family protein [Myxococcota bacterium]|nr:transmembrane 220 family protein [Myxococcota bacterium]
MNLFKRALHGLAVALFVLSAAVQHNDPDPWGWAAVYLVAAALAGLSAAGRPSPSLARGLVGVASLWALSIVPSLGPVTLDELVSDMEMLRPEVELARELGGLLIITLYALPTALPRRRGP